jgi:hypothetical protein
MLPNWDEMSVHQPIVQEHARKRKRKDQNFQLQVSDHIRHCHRPVMSKEGSYEALLPCRPIVFRYPGEGRWRRWLVIVCRLQLYIAAIEQKFEVASINPTPYPPNANRNDNLEKHTVRQYII